jgi:putative peptidoglycan lipid II flippase
VTGAAIVGQAPTAAIPPIIAVTLGATAATDAFFLAFAVVTLVLTTVLAAAQHVSVPFFVDAHHDGRTIFPELATVIAGFSLALLMAAGLLLAIGLPGADAGEAPLAVRSHYWLLAPYGLLAALAGLSVSALNAVRDFSVPALSPAVRSVIVLAALAITAGTLGVAGVALGYVAGEAGRLSLLAIRLQRRGTGPLRFGPIGAIGRAFASRAVVQMVGSGAVAAIPLIDRLTAAGLGPGAVSILDYAERLWQVPVGVVTSGFIIVSLAEWSHDVSTRQSHAALSASMRRSASLLAGLALPASAAVILLRRPIASVLFGHGAFPAEEIGRLADTLGMLVACTPVYVAGLAYTRGFLAFKRTDWLLGISIGLVALKIALNLMLAPIWGLVGIAAATGLAYTAMTVALAAGFHGWLMRRESPGPGALR